MTTITATPSNIDHMLEARVQQTRDRFNIVSSSPVDSGDVAAWVDISEAKEDLIQSVFAQQQNFILQHHLAKTILSTT